VQAILPDCARASYAHLRELVQKGEGGKQVVEEDLRAGWQLGLLHQVQDNIWALAQPGIGDVSVAATIWFKMNAAAISSADSPGLNRKTFFSYK